MGPQRFDTNHANLIVAEVKVLDGREVSQVGPQRFDTDVTNSIAHEAKHLDGREVG